MFALVNISARGYIDGHSAADNVNLYVCQFEDGVVISGPLANTASVCSLSVATRCTIGLSCLLSI